MSSKGWMAQFRTTLGKGQMQGDWHFYLASFVNTEGIEFHGGLSDTSCFQSHLPHTIALLLNLFNPNSCYAVLQSICLSGSLQNITTGNEADSII